MASKIVIMLFWSKVSFIKYVFKDKLAINKKIEDKKHVRVFFNINRGEFLNYLM